MYEKGVVVWLTRSGLILWNKLEIWSSPHHDRNTAPRLDQQNLLIIHTIQVQEREAVILVVGSADAMTEAAANNGQQSASCSDLDLLDFLVYVGHHLVKFNGRLLFDTAQQWHVVVIDI